jgi:hypothetical protein
METREKAGVRGIVRIQLKDKDGNRKPLFQNNKVWDIVHSVLGMDLKIPFITGKWTYERMTHNTITNAGLSETAKLLGGVTADAISHMAIGIGTPTGTALGSEITTGGGERASVTPSSTTTTTTGDTIESVNTFSFTDTFAVTEEGLFNDASAGDMIASQNFSAINVANGDSLQITHEIVMSTS